MVFSREKSTAPSMIMHSFSMISIEYVLLFRLVWFGLVHVCRNACLPSSSSIQFLNIKFYNQIFLSHCTVRHWQQQNDCVFVLLFSSLYKCMLELLLFYTIRFKPVNRSYAMVVYAVGYSMRSYLQNIHLFVGTYSSRPITTTIEPLEIA